ncbi:MAG: helix-turn-helix transcriptional regulator [Gammaproteobacteria bacterium]
MLDGVSPSAVALSPRLVNLAGAGDVSLFWEALVGLIGESVRFHTAFLWYDYVDFATSSKSTLVLESPRRERPSEYWELRRRCHLTPAYLQAHPGLKLHRLSDVAPAEELRKTEFHQKFMQPEGWEHGVTLSFWQQDEVRATLVLYRTPEQGEFTPDALAWLQSLHPLIQAVLFRLIQQQQQQAVQSGMEEFLRGLPVGLILLNWDLRPVLVNDEGYQQALLWNHGQDSSQRDPRGDFQVPLALRKVCERFRQLWLDELVPGQTPRQVLEERLHHARQPQLRAIVSTQHVRSVSPYRPIFLIRFVAGLSSAPLQVVPTDAQLEVLSQLSPAERRVTMLVMQGLSNQEIAHALHREVSTIKDHLSRVYDKLGLKRRTQLTRLLVQ